MASSPARGHAATDRPPRRHLLEQGRNPAPLLAFTVADGHIAEITAVVDPAEPALNNLPDPVCPPYQQRPRTLEVVQA
ncbi:hypothetical protein ABT218_24940 [Streptomyces sp. NPDC001455]|uniref:hypothetical protein n=1 Tax=unclassified Streptomyces TaxID=2593676 RepID=UPI00331BBED1